MKKKLSTIRRLQKKLIDGAGNFAGKVNSGKKIIGGAATEIDEKLNLSDAVRNGVDKTKVTIDKFNNEYRLGEKITTCINMTITKYGDIRETIKPYFPVETSRELLVITKKELVLITSNILQITTSEAEEWSGKFGKALTSKIVGVASTGTLLALVSTFGTAGTGTAIAGLSGAAASNATLAWVGGLLGGGMATGAVLTGGLSLAVGFASYKFLSSEARTYEDLDDIERRIIESCGLLITAITEILEDKDSSLHVNDAEMLFNGTLIPLYEELIKNEKHICSRLDKTNSIAYSQHRLKDFNHNVIIGFKELINDNSKKPVVNVEYIIAGVFYALLSRTVVDGSVESQLVLDALRRSDNDLLGAREHDISDYLASYDVEQLKGIANNVKGIYHEYLFVHEYNQDHDDTYAELFGASNNPGADIQIKDSNTDEIDAEFQLKATDNSSYVREHLTRYPDIEVIATEEVASKLSEVESSGISNSEITTKVNDDIEQLEDNTILDQTVESACLIGLVAVGREALEVLNGNQSASEAGKNATKLITTAAASTSIAAYLFS